MKAVISDIQGNLEALSAVLGPFPVRPQGVYKTAPGNAREIRQSHRITP